MIQTARQTTGVFDCPGCHPFDSLQSSFIQLLSVEKIEISGIFKLFQCILSYKPGFQHIKYPKVLISPGFIVVLSFGTEGYARGRRKRERKVASICI